jgi:hypothetical protein
MMKDIEGLLRGVDKATRRVARTAGPAGAAVRLPGGISTREGYLVAASGFEALEGAERVGAQLIREVTAEAHEKEGAGASMAALLANGILKKSGRQILKEGADPREIDQGIQKAIDVVLADLERQARRVDSVAEAVRIAATAEGIDDEDLRKLMLEAYEAGQTGVEVSVASQRGLRWEATKPIVTLDDEQLAWKFRRVLHLTDATLEGGAVAGGGVALVQCRAALDSLRLRGGQNAGVTSVREALIQPSLHIATNLGLTGKNSEKSVLAAIKEGTFANGIEDPKRVVGNALVTAATKTVATLRRLNVGSRLSSSQPAAREQDTLALGDADGGSPPDVPPAKGSDPPDAGGSDSVSSGREPEKVTRYTEIDCPRRVYVKTDRFLVGVRLTLQKTSEDAEELQVLPGKPVTIRLYGSGCEPLEKPEGQFEIVEGGDSPRLSFAFKPTGVRYGYIRVNFFQEGNPLATPSVPIEFTPFEVAYDAAVVCKPLPTVEFADAPDFCIFIEYADPVLTFMLVPRDGDWAVFEPMRVHDLRQVMDSYYEQLEGIGRSRTDPTALAADKIRVLSDKDADKRINSMGRSLWRKLVPPLLQLRYEAERDRWKDKSVVILSNEPWIPWELLLPNRGTWDDGKPWCETLRLTRWLLPDAASEVTGVPPSTLALQSMTLIIPRNDDLKAVEAEKTFLAEFLERRGVRKEGIEVPTRDAVLSKIETGHYDWVHVAGHGSSSVSGDAPLWLEDGASIVPDELFGPKLEGNIIRRKPAFVFNACRVGRGGWELRRISGWASFLIGANASLFLAPLWNVTDDLAELFIAAFYRAIENELPLGEAVREARKAAAREGDPTRLAYSIYGHPNATVRVGAPR